MNWDDVLDKQDPYGYTIWSVHLEKELFRYMDEHYPLEFGDLVLIPAGPERVIHSIYNYVKSPPQEKAYQGDIFAQAKIITNMLEDPNTLEETSLSSRIIIVDRLLGIQVATVREFLEQFNR